MQCNVQSMAQKKDTKWTTQKLTTQLDQKLFLFFLLKNFEISDIVLFHLNKQYSSHDIKSICTSTNIRNNFTTFQTCNLKDNIYYEVSNFIWEISLCWSIFAYEI